jgi:hypothetical protein
MMRNEEGTIGAKSFNVIQEGSARHYAANIASVVFFAKKCPWDSSSQVLTTARTIIHSLLFEPIVARHPGQSAAEEKRREDAAINAVISIPTDKVPENEFGDQRAMLSRAFPWILPLGALSTTKTDALTSATWMRQPS